MHPRAFQRALQVSRILDLVRDRPGITFRDICRAFSRQNVERPLRAAEGLGLIVFEPSRPGRYYHIASLTTHAALQQLVRTREDLVLCYLTQHPGVAQGAIIAAMREQHQMKRSTVQNALRRLAESGKVIPTRHAMRGNRTTYRTTTGASTPTTSRERPGSLET